MFRRGICRLQKVAVSEFLSLNGAQSQCALWHSSSIFSSKKSKGRKKADSDSDSDGEKRFAVDPKLQKAAEQVAQSVPGEGPKVQSDLLEQLQSFSKLSQSQAATGSQTSSSTDADSSASAKLNTLLSGMQIHKGRDRSQERERTQGRPTDGRRQPFQRRQEVSLDREKVKLFEGPALGFFTAADGPQAEEQPVAEPAPQRLSLWQKVHQEQLSALRNQPPANAFAELIRWTDEGKLWQYPINNEQGLDEEAKVGFHQHVFLEDQIKDFPRRGPIRHFMDLVLVGLSRNPYLTVQQKHEHIDWFRQYFKEKRDLLQEALGPDGLIAEPEQAKLPQVKEKKKAKA